jgi:hypothetical protein
MATELDIKLTTLALIGRLQDEAESEIIYFFKKSVSCGREQAMRAIDNSKLLESSIRDEGKRVFTTSSIFELVRTFITVREQQRIREEQEWSNASPSSDENMVASYEQDSRFEATARSSHEDEEVDMGILASRLQKGEFLVKCILTSRSRDQVKEHDLTAGEVLVISQVRSLGDGTDDAWFCGYKQKDPTKVKKWVFSEHTTRLYN